MKRMFVVGASIVAIMSVSATAKPTKPMSHGAAFVADAMKGDNAEVAMGKLAIERGASPDVKAYGQMLVTDHGAHKAKLVAIGAKLGVRDTAAVPGEAPGAMAHLKGLSGAAFDAAFATHMVADHKKDIAKYRAEAASKDNAELKALATATLPTLNKHLAAAQALTQK